MAGNGNFPYNSGYGNFPNNGKMAWNGNFPNNNKAAGNGNFPNNNNMHYMGHVINTAPNNKKMSKTELAQAMALIRKENPNQTLGQGSTSWAYNSQRNLTGYGTATLESKNAEIKRLKKAIKEEEKKAAKIEREKAKLEEDKEKHKIVDEELQELRRQYEEAKNKNKNKNKSKN